MLQINKHKILWHILFWVGIFLFYFTTIIPYIDFKNLKPTLLNIIFYIMPSFMIYTYPFLYILIPHFLLKGKIIYFIILFILWTIVGMFINRFLSVFYNDFIEPLSVINTNSSKDFKLSDFNNFYFDGLFFWLNLVAGFASGIKLFNFWLINHHHTQFLTNQKITSELELLKSSINPHFLFHTLNNLYNLALYKSVSSPKMVLKFSHLLSYKLYESHVETIDLDKELEMLQNYIELKRIGEEGNFDFSFCITGEISHKRIAPLLLFPFIENAFHYNFNSEREINWLGLDIFVQTETLALKLIHSKNINENSYWENEVAQKIIKRLNLLYAGQYDLKIIFEEEIYIVNFVIQLV